MRNFSKLLNRRLSALSNRFKKLPVPVRMSAPIISLSLVALSLGIWQALIISSSDVYNPQVAGVFSIAQVGTSTGIDYGGTPTVTSTSGEDYGGAPTATTVPNPSPVSTSPFPSTQNCEVVENTIVVSSSDSSKCLNIQQAINNANEGTIIVFEAGSYNIPPYTPNASLEINAKKNITLRGQSSQGNNAVVLNISSNQAGIKINNSEAITVEWMTVRGSSTNGLVRVDNSRGTKLGQLNLYDSNANTVQVYSSHNSSIFNSQVGSNDRIGISFHQSQGITISNNVVSKNGTAITVSDSSGKIFGNMMANNSERGILIAKPQSFEIYSNTIVNTQGGGNPYSAGITVNQIQTSYSTIVEIYKNIIANGVYGLYIDGDVSTIDNFTFAVNDVWNNSQGNYVGVSDQTGVYHNISQDPLFGEDYCISSDSPAAYGYIPLSEYMGSRSICGPTSFPSPSPVATTYPSPPPPSPSLAPSPVVSSAPSPTTDSSPIPSPPPPSPASSLPPTGSGGPVPGGGGGPSQDVCGDSICGSSETAATCSADCGVGFSPVPSPTVVPVPTRATNPGFFIRNYRGLVNFLRDFFQ